MIYSRSFSSPVGMLTVRTNENAVLELRFSGDGSADGTPLLLDAERQLAEYFAGERREFTLPVSPEGTDFQLKVWRALLKIPYGGTLSYKALAKMIGNERACRAVGGANNRNPIPIIIPCHRVIGSDGTLVGYAGGTDIKKILLNIEKSGR